MASVKGVIDFEKCLMFIEVLYGINLHMYFNVHVPLTIINYIIITMFR